jgi:hypothetical protein
MKTFLISVIFLALIIPDFYCIGNKKEGISLKLYVSTAGNDAWSGKYSIANKSKTDGPFATLEGARDVIRELKRSGNLPKGNLVVEVQEGVYELSKTFELNDKDKGENELSCITYTAGENKEVRLVGGRVLGKWIQTTDAKILDMLPQPARGRIWQIDLHAMGISDFGSPGGGGMELFFDDKPMWLSRFPNKGYLKITELKNEIPFELRSNKGDSVGKFYYDNARINKWKDEKDAWVHGYWFFDWSEQRHKIADIDTAKKLIEVVPPYHIFGYRKGQWFYGFNLLSEIDEPGEYYIDRENGILYFYPPSDINKGHSFVSINNNIIDINESANIRIKGLILEACRKVAVTIKNCNNIVIESCTIRNSGDWAVTIRGGIHNGVKACDIYDVGAGGISINAGDRKTLVPAECFADNNYIHHIARIKRVYNPGISLSGVGNLATHNLIAHVPHMAMGFGGNEQLIEFNEIYDACYESNDAGAIYTGRNWTMRGNIIRYNYLHDISGFEGKGCVGIYLDDAFSSADIIGNVFEKVSRAMMIGGGRDNNVINNIFVDCVPALHVDARGMGWMKNMHIPDWLKEAEEKGTISGIAYNRPPYSTRYPKLASILNEEPAAPKGNVISHNICLGGNWDKPSGRVTESIEDKARPYLIMEDNVVAPNSGIEGNKSGSYIIADPLFVNRLNPEQGKFRLAAESPALKIGFSQIPFDKIGLYKSDDRTRLPVSKR